MEDKKISEMAELLFKGVKMLSHHCPECGVPLFQDGDRIFCPSCGRDVIFESEVKGMKNAEKAEVREEKGEGRGETAKSPVEIKGSDTSDVKCAKTQSFSSSADMDETLEKALYHLSRAALKLCTSIEEENDFSLLERKIKALKELTESAERLIKIKEVFQ